MIASARSSKKTINRVDGEQRARIYFLAYMTGLRKGELASLSPKSFDLDAERPTVTVEAGHSKHRRKDVLPLHPELVAELRKWFVGLAPSDKLFPDLAGKNTADMVKYDLEKIGIPYRNDAGVADFHAAGRHTHITELVRSGASLPEVKELARHSDIKMTMKYTHIGMEDQARAISNLPMPKANPNGRSATALQMRLHSRRLCRVLAWHRMTMTSRTRSSLNPCNRKGLGTGSRRLSLRGKKAPVGVEPADHEGLSFAALPVCVPRRIHPAPSTGFEPVFSCVTGRRALLAAPRGHNLLQVAQVGVEPTASLVLSQGGLPIAYRAAVPRAGVEPANARV